MTKTANVTVKGAVSNVSATINVKLSDAAAPIATEPVDGESYKLGLYSAGLGKFLFADGGETSRYEGTKEAYADGVDVIAIADSGNWKLKTADNNRYFGVVQSTSGSGTSKKYYANIAVNSDTTDFLTDSWTWDATNGYFKAAVTIGKDGTEGTGEDVVNVTSILGGNGTYNTLATYLDSAWSANHYGAKLYTASAVEAKLRAFKLVAEQSYVAVADTLQLSGVATDPSYASVPSTTYSSSDETIATVSAAGLVTGVAKGSAVITATTASSVSATFDVAVASVVYSLTASNAGSTGNNSNYAQASEFTQNGVTWMVCANIAIDGGWRFGGKSLDKVDRSMYSSTAVASDSDKIVISLAGTGGNITVNSMKVGVYSTAELAAAGGDGDVATFAPKWAANSTIILDKQDSASWANCFFGITFNVTVTQSSNKYIALGGLTLLSTK